MEISRSKSGLIRKFGALPLVCSLALGASAASVNGCSSEPLSNAGLDQVGTLGLNLTVAPGVTLIVVDYTITGNGVTKSGNIDVEDAPTISGKIGGIPAGK